MRLRFLVPLVLAATALADPSDPLTQQRIEALTPLDSLPSTTALDGAFGDHTMTAQNLQAIALAPDNVYDFGVQLRAIRALPDYCPLPPSPCGVDPPGTDTLVHAALLQILSDFNAIPVPSPHDLLRVRAAIEALGIAGLSAALTSDANTLVGFLNSTSRDVRATTAKALGNLCIQTANTALLARFVAEQSAQVRLAISAALRNLKFVCPGGM